MLRTSLWLVRPGLGYIFMVSFAESLYLFNLLFYFYYLFFSFLFLLCPFLKIESLGLGLFFDFFVFYLVLVKLESGFQMNNLSSVILILIFFWVTWDFLSWSCYQFVVLRR